MSVWAVVVALGVAEAAKKAVAIFSTIIAAFGRRTGEKVAARETGVATKKAVARLVTAPVARREPGIKGSSCRVREKLPLIVCAVGSARDRRLVRREGRGLVVRRQPPAMDGGERHSEVDEHRKPWSLHRPVERFDVMMTKLWCKGAWSGYGAEALIWFVYSCVAQARAARKRAERPRVGRVGGLDAGI